jgi:cholinesterase
MRFIHSASLAVLSAVVSATPAQWTAGQAVDTTSGTVVGHAAKNAPAVSEYLGIPFAVPPVGKLRWTAPQPFPKSAQPIQAAKFGAECPQGGKGSEDCLTLNVWTKPQSGEKKKAVLVWIYGGGFTSGSTSSPTYNGAHFADKQDVVLVSVK